MKKKLLILFLIMLFPLICNAETCEPDKVTINSIYLENVEGGTSELEPASSENRDININLQMSNVGDAILYKLELKNDSDSDFEFNEDSIGLESDYISYTLVSDDEDNIIKANSSKTLFLKVEYKNEVPLTSFTNNVYDDTGVVQVQLLNNSINVPDTLKDKDYIPIIIFLIVSFIFVLFTLKIFNKNYKIKTLILIISLVTLLPIAVNAVCKCEISINSSIKIVKNDILSELLGDESESCVSKYEGNVTDELGKTVSAQNVNFAICDDKRNIIFDDICWQVIRTTETGGLKVIYNGEAVDGKCDIDRAEHKTMIGQRVATTVNMGYSYLYGNSFSYDLDNGTFTLLDTETATFNNNNYRDLVGKYTCKNTSNTCTELYRVESISYSRANYAYLSKYIIDYTTYSNAATSSFNSNYTSLASVSYMLDSQSEVETYGLSRTSTYTFGSTVTYDSETDKYTLGGDIITGKSSEIYNDIKTHRYTCGSTSDSCNVMNYIYETPLSSSLSAFKLRNGRTIEDVFNELLFGDNLNRVDSSAKAILDKWFENNLADKVDYLEDAVYCNDRSFAESSGLIEGQGDMTKDISFKENENKDDLSCQRELDQFTLSNSKAKLKYPVGLIRASEANYLSKANVLLIMTEGKYWTMSPATQLGTNTRVIGIDVNGNFSNSNSYGWNGLRPVIVLKNSVKIVNGDGSTLNPWIVE